MWNISSELSQLLKRKNASMLPNPQNWSLMNLVVELQNELLIQPFLISPAPLFLHKTCKSLIAWRYQLHYKNNLKLAIVLKLSWGDWRTHRQMHIHVHIILPSSFPPFLLSSHNAMTETSFSLRNQHKKFHWVTPMNLYWLLGIILDLYLSES